DKLVTGVQTCALPISPMMKLIDKIIEQALVKRATEVQAQPGEDGVRVSYCLGEDYADQLILPGRHLTAFIACIKQKSGLDSNARSEERRVGKECRGGG